jgi:hypothetical protein
VRCVTVCINRRCPSTHNPNLTIKEGNRHEKDTTITNDEEDVEDVEKETGDAAAIPKPRQNHDLDTKQGSPFHILLPITLTDA